MVPRGRKDSEAYGRVHGEGRRDARERAPKWAIVRAAAVLFLGLAWTGCSDSPTEGDDGQPDIAVVSASVSVSDVLINEPVAITAVLENRGEEPGSATVSLEVNGEEAESRTVAVAAPGEGEGTASTQAEVEFTWSTAEAGAYALSVNGTHAGTVSVEAEPAPTADIRVESAEAVPTTVEVEESVAVIARVHNHGDGEGQETFSLEVDGQEIETRTITLGAGSEQDVAFSWSSNDPGTYDLSVNGHHAGTVTVEAEPASDIQVEDADVDPTTVEAGESVTVSVTVENHGDAQGTKSLELEVDGQGVESQSVTVGAGQQETATFSWSSNDPDTYDLSVNGHHAGTVTVEEAPEADLQVESADAQPTTVQTGESVTVSVTVENHGDAQGTKSLELEVDGQGVESQSVTVGAGQQETATFSWSSNDPDTYDLSVNGHHAGTVTVEADPAQLSVTAAYTDPSDPVETMTAVAVAEVSNTGGATGALTVDFTVDGSQEGSETVQVSPGDTETVQFDWTPEEAGAHTLGFNQYTLGVDVLAALEFVDTWLPQEQVYVSQTPLVAVELYNRTETNQQVDLVLQTFTFISGQPMWVTVDETSGTISPGTFEGPAFAWSPPAVGEWPLRLGNQEMGLHEAGVLEAYGIEVTDAYLSSTVVDVDEEVDIGVDAQNHADEAVLEDITLQVYAPPSPNRPARWLSVETTEWSMNAGASFQWGDAFTLEFSDTGEYPIRVCDEVSCEDAGTVTVSSR